MPRTSIVLIFCSQTGMMSHFLFQYHIPHLEKLARFLANRESFPLNHLPCTVHNGMGLIHRNSFQVNSVFCAQPRKFSPLEIFAIYGIYMRLGTYKNFDES